MLVLLYSIYSAKSFIWYIWIPGRVQKLLSLRPPMAAGLALLGRVGQWIASWWSPLTQTSSNRTSSTQPLYPRMLPGGGGGMGVVSSLQWIFTPTHSHPTHSYSLSHHTLPLTHSHSHHTLPLTLPLTTVATKALALPPPGAEVLAPNCSIKERTELLTRGPSLVAPILYLQTQHPVSTSIHSTGRRQHAWVKLLLNWGYCRSLLQTRLQMGHTHLQNGLVDNSKGDLLFTVCIINSQLVVKQMSKWFSLRWHMLLGCKHALQSVTELNRNQPPKQTGPSQSQQWWPGQARPLYKHLKRERPHHVYIYCRWR